jgi:hypothetical protein
MRYYYPSSNFDATQTQIVVKTNNHLIPWFYFSRLAVLLGNGSGVHQAANVTVRDWSEK